MKGARLLVLVLAVASAGCATGGGGPSGPRPQPNHLTQDEIRGSEYGSTYDVVAALRPRWLRTRGQISIGNPEAGQVMVYLDGVLVGGAEFLRQLNAREVVSMEFVSEIEAGARFGLRQDGGAAILVNTSPSR